MRGCAANYPGDDGCYESTEEMFARKGRQENFRLSDELGAANTRLQTANWALGEIASALGLPRDTGCGKIARAAVKALKKA